MSNMFTYTFDKNGYTLYMEDEPFLTRKVTFLNAADEDKIEELAKNTSRLHFN